MINKSKPNRIYLVPHFYPYKWKFNTIKFDYNSYMSITLKEFAQFMIDFVNKNFIPILQNGNS